MEEDEIEAQACRLPRVGNGSDGSRNRFHSWHPSSRIIRVSRASGGKDRHSKVMTSKGLRDRRVRLSVSTAIQFYDLQDRLGYDQPSKAVEWLIKSAQDAIAELPSLNYTYPPNSDEQELDGENDTNQQQKNNNLSQNISLSKSACSSNSETSKGSGLSLSRSVNRVKARERARERTAKEKEKEKEKENESHNNIANHHHNVNTISQTASFTELLTGAVPTTNSPNQNHAREQWCSPSLSAPMDYLSSGLLGPSSSSRTHNHNHGFSVSQIQLGHNSLPETMSFYNNYNSSYSNYSQLQQFSLMPDHHHHQLMSANGNDYNLNFSISGYNRGTLQSNSPSLFPHFIDGSTVPFFIGAAPTIHHHKFSSDHKGKAKN